VRRWVMVAVVGALAAIGAAAAVRVIDPDAVANERPARPAASTPPLAARPDAAPHRARRPRPWHPSVKPVPILMYHVIGVPRPGAPYPGLFVAPALFREQVASLRRHGFRAVTLDRVIAAWAGRATLPRHPVVLSFDDGYLGDATVARPVLARVRWPGVLNLIVSRMWSGNGARLTVGMVRSMVARGWEVDSHTITHRDLTTLAPGALEREVERSRTLLRRMFHVPVEGFCYPAGRYDAAVLRDVRHAGYRFATTELPGAATPRDDRLQLPRIRVSAGERPSQLDAVIGRALAAAHSR
jgi:peptidoglycan/xylan/chitin deacetylase (PgdA/CDA1 family)